MGLARAGSGLQTKLKCLGHLRNVKNAVILLTITIAAISKLFFINSREFCKLKASMLHILLVNNAIFGVIRTFYRIALRHHFASHRIYTPLVTTQVAASCLLIIILPSAFYCYTCRKDQPTSPIFREGIRVCSPVVEIFPAARWLLSVSWAAARYTVIVSSPHLVLAKVKLISLQNSSVSPFT